MEIVEHEHERPRRREPLKQLAHCPMHAIPLDLKRRAATGDKGGQGRKDLAELGAHLVIEATQPPRLKALDVVVERVHEHPERQVALLLGPASAEHQHPVSLDAIPELGQQPGLPDPRRAEQLDRGGLAGLETAERRDEPIELRGATYEIVRKLLHIPHREHRPRPAGRLRVLRRTEQYSSAVRSLRGRRPRATGLGS